MTETNKPSTPSKNDMADELQSKAHSASRQLKEKGSEQLEQYESRAAGSMESVAEAAHRAAESLGESNQTMLSQYVGELASGISDLADSLRHKNTDEILDDVGRLARENAGLFLLGSVAIGFGLARIAKASERHSDESEHSWEGYYGVGTAEYEESESHQSKSRHEGRASEHQSGSGSSSESRQRQSSFSETDADARPSTHAGTSYMPEEGSGAAGSQESRAGETIIGSETKPPSGGDNSQRRV